MSKPMPFTVINAGASDSQVELHDPTLLPKSAGFLWNKKMMIQMNCRGFAVAQFMQPEPAKYAYAPNIEAKTFMQPEHHYYANHPGRFFYIKDEDNNNFFSAPYEPVKGHLDSYKFIISDSEISWQIENLALRVEITLTLATDDAVEIWSCQVTNLSNKPRNISVYPYFPIGYMSWMNQSADYHRQLNAIVATAITPYQKVEQYFENKELKDKTFFLADEQPTAWLANQNVFEGEGGLTSPDALKTEQLSNTPACYEVPAAVMQYQRGLIPEQTCRFNFLFGPAKDEAEIAQLKAKYLQDNTCLQQAKLNYVNYLKQAKGCLTIHSNDKAFDDMVNHWLPRQMFYHGDVNRLTTDPQTRNYIQDNMGMAYLAPAIARQAILTALSQQAVNGAMPDGILLHQNAELKYINQVPHADHCVWLPICLMAYLNESNDAGLLTELLNFADSDDKKTVAEHIELAIDWLLQARDYRGLSLIEQGDWCDPMNMVGYKGKGVSAWLTLATIYAINCWRDICQQYLADCKQRFDKLEHYSLAAEAMMQAVQTHLWDGQWFARGITDDDVVFGIKNDKEGKIYLNPQSWALLSGAASDEQKASMLLSIAEQLTTPYGVMMLAPSYTKMREDVGRLTQKYPGVSENGSVYNHAAVFYAYSLYQHGEHQQAFEVLKAMIPNFDDAVTRGQLPVYIPNYYRGAYFQLPEQAGKSSHLFNTGTLAWFYRCIVEELCGLKGEKGNLLIQPKLPKSLQTISGVRTFQQATFHFVIKKVVMPSTSKQLKVTLDGNRLDTHLITGIQAGKSYQLIIELPFDNYTEWY